MLVIFANKKLINSKLLLQHENNLNVKNIIKKVTIEKKQSTINMLYIGRHILGLVILLGIVYIYYKLLTSSTSDIYKIKLSNTLRNVQKKPDEEKLKLVFNQLHEYYKNNNQFAKHINEDIWFNILEHSTEIIKEKITWPLIDTSQVEKQEEKDKVIKHAENCQNIISLQLLIIVFNNGYDEFNTQLTSQDTKQLIENYTTVATQNLLFTPTGITEDNQAVLQKNYEKILQHYFINQKEKTKKEITHSKSYWETIKSWFTSSI